MIHLTFEPQPDLAALVKCYWTLEVPAREDVEKQLIVPDGCIEMAFILGDDIMRYTSDDEFVLQPRAMILGQITRQFYIKPTGDVDSFAVRFYPYGFASFAQVDINALSNTETPLAAIFGEEVSRTLAKQILHANNTQARIKIVESFLLHRLSEKETIDKFVHEAVEAILGTKGSGAIEDILNGAASGRRRLERAFRQKIGLSPKQLSKVIRLQAAMKMVLNRQSQSLTEIAYESDYYDQAHFIRDFKEFTGTTPRKFLGAENMSLSAAIYK